MIKEEWKDIKERKINGKNQFRSFSFYLPEDIISPSIATNGYNLVTFYKKGKKQTLKVARLVAKTFVNNRNKKPEVNHRDGRKTNDRMYNLEWCTRSENMKHAFCNGLLKPRIGTLNGMSKLNKNEVKKIRKMGKEKNHQSSRKIGKLFKVSHNTVLRIIKNKSYT